MNGVFNVKIKGDLVPLKFGLQAVILFQERLKDSGLKVGSTEYNMKSMMDLFYCGLFGHAMRKELPLPSYPDALDLFDNMMLEPDFSSQVTAMWDAFNAVMYVSEEKPEEGEDTIKKKTTKKSPVRMKS